MTKAFSRNYLPEIYNEQTSSNQSQALSISRLLQTTLPITVRMRTSW